MAHLVHYPEAHPFVFRVTHWINLICMFLLILSGIEIHYPIIGGMMGLARGLHIFCAFVILINLIFRIVASGFIKSSPYYGSHETKPDMYTFLPQKDNRHQLGAWIKYYLFLKKDHPLGGKYGVPQKLSYILVAVALLFMGYTGFALWGPTMEIPFFAGFTAAVGGLMKVRIIHYFMMFFFICFTLIHLYLANIEGFGPTMVMLFGKKSSPGLTYDAETMNISGYDSMGEEPEEEAEEEAAATA
jgi:Ni/Fe-hydrogenase 1 B-type cytochrome subunit